jgi:dihydrofolate reductase
MPSSSWQFAHAARAGLVDIHRLLVFPMVVGGGKQLFADGASSSGFRPLPTPAAVLGSFWIIKAADLDGALRWALEASKAGAGSRYVRSRTSPRS